MAFSESFSERELKILQARAERAARSLETETQGLLITVLVVTTGQEDYALPIDLVANVYEGMAITPLPCVPAGVAGLVNVRGHIVLALDLAHLLNLQSPESAALVVLANDQLGVAFLVEKIKGVETLSASTILPIPQNVNLAQAAYVQGLLPNGAALLDVNTILTDPALSAS